MKDNNPKVIRVEREVNKHWLDNFPNEKPNIFDKPVDKVIEDLKKKLQEAYQNHDKLIELEINNPESFNEHEEQANLLGRSLYDTMQSYLKDTDVIEDELFCLFEMKIIYAFKHIEISIKQLLYLGYRDDTINKQFKWDSLVQYLGTKKINLKAVNAHEEINQLRNVNNSLKHSSSGIDQSIKNIPEFKDKNLFTYLDLESFYNRVKMCPNTFLTSLASEVFKNVYFFTQEKIQEISESFALRMDKEDALLLSSELLKHYE